MEQYAAGMIPEPGGPWVRRANIRAWELSEQRYQRRLAKKNAAKYGLDFAEMEVEQQRAADAVFAEQEKRRAERKATEQGRPAATPRKVTFDEVQYGGDSPPLPDYWGNDEDRSTPYGDW